ncbi:unnamed protein product, partial [Bemisia tabaci]
EYIFIILLQCLWSGSGAKAFGAYGDDEEAKLAENRHILVLKQVDWGADPLVSPEESDPQHLTTRAPGALLRCMTRSGGGSRRERERREQMRREIEETRRQLESSMVSPSQRGSGNNQRANQEPARGAQTPRNSSSRNRGTQVQDIQQVPQFSTDPGWTDIHTYPQMQQMQQQTQRRSSGYNTNSRSRSQQQLTVNIPQTPAAPNGRWWHTGSRSPPQALSPTSGNPLHYDYKR